MPSDIRPAPEPLRPDPGGSWAPTRHLPVRLPLSLIAAAIGVVLVITGSFLPWLVSGQVSRNSYQVTAIADRLGILGDGFAGSLVGAWPLVGPVCFLPVIAGLIRWWRVAGALSVAVGAMAAVLSGGILLVGSGKSGAGISLDSTGPGVMVAGGLTLVLAGVVLLTVRPSAR